MQHRTPRVLSAANLLQCGAHPVVHLLHQHVGVFGRHPLGRNRREHLDCDAVAPVEEAVAANQHIGTLGHHRENRHARLARQHEGTRLEAMDFAILRTRSLGEDGHRSAAREPELAFAQQLLHRLRGTAAVDADVAVQEEELTEEGNLVYLALRNPPEIERQVVERRNVDDRAVVDDDYVALTTVDMLAADDTLPPQGRNGEEDAHQDSREFMHRTARPVEGPAQHERKGRKHHEKGAQQDEEDVENQAQHGSSANSVVVIHLANLGIIPGIPEGMPPIFFEKRGRSALCAPAREARPAGRASGRDAADGRSTGTASHIVRSAARRHPAIPELGAAGVPRSESATTAAVSGMTAGFSR